MVSALAAALVLSSPAFHQGGTIPTRYTCDGANVSPPLRWAAPPHGTVSLSLTVFDPDAPGGGFLHWRIAKLSPRLRSLPTGSHLGVRPWTGPCPPAGPAHHYRFTLRALGTGGKVLATARLVGLYGR